MNTSSFDRLDALQTTRAFNLAPTTFSAAPPKTKKTKFGSILSDLSSFLTTAADTAVTVDGVINGSNKKSGNSGLTPEQQMALTGAQKSSGNNMTSLLLIGGAIAVGGGIIYTLLQKKS